MSIKKEENMRRKSQYSIELLMVMVIAIFIMIPAGAVFYYHLDSISNRISDDMIFIIGSEITNNAKLVYNFGEPSRISFDVAMPHGIYNMSINVFPNGDSEFLLEAESKELQYPFFVDFKLNGSFSTKDFSNGKKVVTCEALYNEDLEYRYVLVSFE